MKSISKTKYRETIQKHVKLKCPDESWIDEDFKKLDECECNQLRKYKELWLMTDYGKCFGTYSENCMTCKGCEFISKCKALKESE